MVDVLLLHHAQGLTAGIQALAQRIRDEGHAVHAPDLYDGHTFDRLEDGIAHAGAIGFGEVSERGVRAARGLPDDLVVVGSSLGVMPAQALAQTRPGVRGAVLLHACVPVEEFSPAWPDSVPVQVHGMADDPIFRDEGDLDAARTLVASAADAELFLYPGDQHLFTDSSLSSHDEAATGLVLERVLPFLARC